MTITQEACNWAFDYAHLFCIDDVHDDATLLAGVKNLVKGGRKGTFHRETSAPLASGLDQT